MYQDWFRTFEMPMDLVTWRRLPRNDAYKYELLSGKAHISPRHRNSHCTLQLNKHQQDSTFARWLRAKIEVRPLDRADDEKLVELMAAAFVRVAPFETLEDEERLAAARDCLSVTWEGREGEFVPWASFVAWDTRRSDAPLGAAFVTLINSVSPGRPIVPHLTWLFVQPHYARAGIGRALLNAIVPVLLNNGHQSLESTMHAGNHASLFWHWRHGFELIPRDW